MGAIGGLGSTVRSSSGVRGEAPAAVGFYSIQMVPEMLSEVKMLGLRNLIISDLEAFVSLLLLQRPGPPTPPLRKLIGFTGFT